MTMTFKEWYDSKSQDAKDYINQRCQSWIAPLTKTGYRGKENLNTVQSILNQENRYADGVKYKFGVALIIKNGGTMDDIVKYLGDRVRDIPYEALKVLDIEDRKTVAKKLVKKKLDEDPDHKLDFRDWLYIQEDYGNLDVSLLDSDLEIGPCLSEILGEDKALNYAREHVEAMYENGIFPKNGTSNVLFDTLFFGENGWTDEQKNKLIKNIASSRVFNTYSSTKAEIMNAVELFIKNICLVDKKCLKYLYRLIQYHQELAVKLYEEKKPETELTGNETSEMTYRYPMWLRKLFLIMGCCARKKVSKANADKLKKEGVALLNLYGYDFDSYFTSWIAQNPEY